MLKKIFIIIGSFLILVIILFSTTNFEQSIVVQQNNDTKKPILIVPNKYKDRFCNMTIKDITYSAQAILPNKNTLFFDDIGCLVLWLDKQQNKDDIVLWVWGKDVNNYIDAKKAWYSMSEATPMSYGFGAYKLKKKDYLDFDTIVYKILNKQTLANPKVRKAIFGNN